MSDSTFNVEAARSRDRGWREAAVHEAKGDLDSRLKGHLFMQGRYVLPRALRTALFPIAAPAVVADVVGDIAVVEFNRAARKHERTAVHYHDLKSTDDLDYIDETFVDASGKIADLNASIEEFKEQLTARPGFREPPQRLAQGPGLEIPTEVESSRAPAAGYVLPRPIGEDEKQRLAEAARDEDARITYKLSQSPVSMNDRPPTLTDVGAERRVRKDVESALYPRWLQHFVAQAVTIPGRVYSATIQPLYIPGLTALSVGDAAKVEVDRREKKSDLTRMFTVNDRVRGESGTLASKAVSAATSVDEIKNELAELREKLGRPGSVTVPMRPRPHDIVNSGHHNEAQSQGSVAPGPSDAESDPLVAPATGDSQSPTQQAEPKISRWKPHLLTQLLYLPGRILIGLANPLIVPASVLSAAGDAIGVEQNIRSRKADLKGYGDLDIRKQAQVRRVTKQAERVFDELTGLKSNLSELRNLVDNQTKPESHIPRQVRRSALLNARVAGLANLASANLTDRTSANLSDVDFSEDVEQIESNRSSRRSILFATARASLVQPRHEDHQVTM